MAKKQGFLKGAAILAAAMIITKILGAIYKIILGNILDDSGFALFSAAYSIFAVFLTISTTGLPIALSKMVSEANSLGNTRQVRKIYHVAYAVCIVLGAVCFSVMFFFSKQFAELMANPDAVYCIMALAPSVLLLCLISAYRGLFQGLSDMKPTAISQVIEVAVKVILGLGLAAWLTRLGHETQITSAGAIFGTTAGSFLCFVYLFILKQRRSRDLFPPTSKDAEVESSRVILSRLVKIGVPIILASSVLSFTGMIDTFQIMHRLQYAAGFSIDEAEVLYGAFTKVTTIHGFPPSFIAPLTMSLIPAVTARLTRHDRFGASQISVSSLRLATALALPAGVGLCVLSQPIITTLFPNTHEAAIPILSILGISSFFLCLSILTTSILQAYGKTSIPIYTMLAGGLVKIAVNYILVGGPYMNIIGASIGTTACYAVICVSNMVILFKNMPQMPNLFRVFVKPAFASALMGAGVYASYPLIAEWIGSELFGSARLSTAVSMTLAIGIGVIIYGVLVIALQIITKEDLELTPNGKKLGRFIGIR